MITRSKSHNDRREKPMKKGRTQVGGKNCPSNLRSEAAEWVPPADFPKSRAYVAPRYATHERARKERHGHSAGGEYYGQNYTRRCETRYFKSRCWRVQV